METPAGFERFVRTHERELLRAAWLLTGEFASAEDLVQTALAATWPRWSQIERTDAPQVYVRRVMVTTYLRWQRRRWNLELATHDLPETAGTDEFDASDRRDILSAALRSLPARQRTAIVLRFFLDLSERATATAMGCTPGTVKTHTARGLTALRGTSLLADLLAEGAPE
jgi:RNA polymerase sigma-70 factor (sigma-E family)